MGEGVYVVGSNSVIVCLGGEDGPLTFRSLFISLGSSFFCDRSGRGVGVGWLFLNLLQALTTEIISVVTMFAAF